MKITSVNFEKCRFSRKKGRRLLDIELRNKKKLTLKLLPLNKDLGQNRAASLNDIPKIFIAEEAKYLPQKRTHVCAPQTTTLHLCLNRNALRYETGLKQVTALLK